MKKNAILFCVAILGITTLSVTSSSKSLGQSSLSNLSIMNAAAGEAYCKDNSDNACTLESGGVKLTGKGQPYINN